MEENTQNVTEVVEVVEEAAKAGVNFADLGKKGAIVAGGGLALYGAYKLVEKPVKKFIAWVGNKFKKKENADNEAQPEVIDVEAKPENVTTH